MSPARSHFSYKGFTLIELLVVIAIIAVLAVVVVLTLNPGQLILQSRDSTRLSDLASLQSAISLYQTDRAINGTVSLGSSSIVYVSLPDPAATTTAGTNCSSLNLPALPPAYTYHCAASSTFRSVNGLGWIPVNLSSISSGAPLGQLPIDPTNASSSRSYLTYTTNGTQYEVTSQIESSKYKLGGSNDVASLDGGTQTSLYEKGTNLTLEPLDYGDSSLVGYWTFDEGSGSIAYDYSGNNATGSWSGSGTHYATGKVGTYAGQFNGTSTGDYVGLGNVPLLGPNSITIAGWIKLNTTGQWMMFDKGFGTNSGDYYIYGGDSSGGQLTLYGSGLVRSDTTGALIVGQWNHIVGTYDAGSQTAKIYTNSQLRNTSVGVGLGSGATSSLYIGNYGSGGGYNVNGLIDDVRVYNRALSAAEIQALYNNGR